MASKRCPQCAIDFPSHFLNCLVKECRTTLLVSPHGTTDPNWQDKVDRRNKYDGVEIRTDRNGQSWISERDVARLGYAVVVGTILELNDSFFEVNGHSPAKGAYWIEEVIVDGAADSLEPAMFLGP